MSVIQRPESEARIAAMFDRIAGRYDLLNRLLSMRQDQRWRKELTKRVPYRPGGKFLDVATGTGDVLEQVRFTHREYDSVVGVDISGEMLNLAKEKLAAQKGDPVRGSLPRVEFHRRSAEELELPDGAFDAMAISFGLRNVVRKDKALAEFRRVLKPGGTLLILEFFLPKRGLLAALFQLYFHTILPAIGGLISDRAAYKYLPQSVGSFYSPEQMRAALYEQSFQVAEVKSFLFGACRLVHATKTSSS